jgi:hypothetical protein
MGTRQTESETEQPLNILIKQLKHEFERDETGANVKNILETYLNKNPIDWKKYCFFCEYKYARNLIEINEQFELMVQIPLVFLNSTRGSVL